MGNRDYTTSTVNEFFEILDNENKKKNHIVAKSLVKYLQKSKVENELDQIKKIQWS